jgi:uncharacterized protein YaaN involved in tellurite resistance
MQNQPGTQEVTPRPDTAATRNGEPILNSMISEASGGVVPALDMDSVLSEADRKAIQSFSSRIDLSGSDDVILYGSDSQKKISTFADSILVNANNADSSEVISALENLVVELRVFETATQKPTGFRAFFSNAKRQIKDVKIKYDKIAVQVEKIAEFLENQQIKLLKDVAMLTRLYELNHECFRQLTMYILAGEIRLKEVRGKELSGSGNASGKGNYGIDIEKRNDLSERCERFEKKLYDLKLTCQISMQMSLQIRVLQGNNSLLVERIQSTLANTLPLWKNQMVLALGMQHARDAMTAQRTVTNLANEFLVKNADELKRGTTAVARESERGVVDIETLVMTNRSLIDTVSEVIRIQSESRAKRAEAEKVLITLESDLKNKLQ